MSHTTSSWIISLLSLLLVGGCATFIEVPQRFASVQEAFPDRQSMIPPKEQANASVEATYPASYDYVYRAVLVSVTQALLNVKEEHKGEGYILAETVPVGQTSRRLFFAIRIEEIAGKQTHVVVAAKAQQHCKYANKASALNVASLGMIGGISALGGEKDFCLDRSRVHWAGEVDSKWAGTLNSGDRSAREDDAPVGMNNVITFTRNNLIAAVAY